MTALQSKYSGWLIHLTAWAVIFGMPLFVTSPDRPLMTGSEYLRFLLVPLSFMVVFYTNYFLLIERYLFTRQTGRFLGGNALLIAAVIVGLHLLFRYVLPPCRGRGRTPCVFSPETPRSTCWWWVRESPSA